MNALNDAGNWFKRQYDAANTAVKSEIGRYNNRKFLEAMVAMAAYVSYADGNCSSEEKQKLFAFIERSPELKVFKASEVITGFKKYADQFDFDKAIGAAEALKAIGALRGDPASARMLVRVGIMIGGSDGNFDEKEKDVVRIICKELGLPPSDFDL